ncbi:unnamed protein product [Orchesella dallaii]|uniref:C2H2-type domain-containing protein n=1 Tax=Orchesella dallaii TaxID=48710 RepID=A0ABP1PUA3_9HEXA
MGDKDQGGSKRLRETEHDCDDEAEQSSSSSKRQRPSEERESEPSQLQPPFAPIDFGSVINSVIASELAAWKEKNKRVCPICDATFPRGLLEHLLTHSEERPYSCELCSEKCRRNQSLERHFRNKHEKSPREAKDLVEAAEHKYLKENSKFFTNDSLNGNRRCGLHADTRETALRKQNMYPFYDPRVIENLVSMHFNYIRSREQRQEPHGPQQVENSNQIPNSAQKFGRDITQENSQMILYGVVPYSCSSSSISSVSRSDRESECDSLEQDDVNELENAIRQNLAEYENDIEFGPELPVSPVPFNEEQSQRSNLSVIMETEEIVSNRDNAGLAQVDLNTKDGGSEIIEEENDTMPMDIDVTDDESNALQREEEEEVQSKNESFEFEDLHGLTDAIPGPSHACSDAISQEEMSKPNPSVPALKDSGLDVIIGDLESATSAADTGETIENMQVNNGTGDDHDDSNELHTPTEYYDTQENVEVRANVITVLEGDHGQQLESDGGEGTSAQPRANSTTSQDGERHVQFIPEQKNPKKSNTKLDPNHSKILAANSMGIRCRRYSSPGTTKHVQSQKQKGAEQRELNQKKDKDQPRVAINLQQCSGKIRPRIMSPDMNGYLHFHRHTRALPQSSAVKRLESEIRNGEWEQSVIPRRGVFVQAIVLLIWLFLVIFWSIFL